MTDGTEVIKIYNKAAVPIVGTYKQYAAKNTNAGMDYNYVQLSSDFVLYYTKGELVGFIFNGKATVQGMEWSIRGSYQLTESIKRHQMNVIASKHGVELNDHFDYQMAFKYWYCNGPRSRYLRYDKTPYILRESVERGELTTELLDEIWSAEVDQFA